MPAAAYPPPGVIQVQIPQGCGPGSTIQVRVKFLCRCNSKEISSPSIFHVVQIMHNGVPMNIVVPPNSYPGSIINVQVPTVQAQPQYAQAQSPQYSQPVSSSAYNYQQVPQAQYAEQVSYTGQPSPHSNQPIAYAELVSDDGVQMSNQIK